MTEQERFEIVADVKKRLLSEIDKELLAIRKSILKQFGTEESISFRNDYFLKPIREIDGNFCIYNRLVNRHHSLMRIREAVSMDEWLMAKSFSGEYGVSDRFVELCSDEEFDLLHFMLQGIECGWEAGGSYSENCGFEMNVENGTDYMHMVMAGDAFMVYAPNFYSLSKVNAVDFALHEKRMKEKKEKEEDAGDLRAET